MATNDFKAFAIDPLANVIDQATYQALAALGTGFQAGIAKSDELNKAWRQSSIGAYIIGQYIMTQTGLDALDDGDLATLLARFTNAVTIGSAVKPARIVTVSTPLVISAADYAIGLNRTVGVAAVAASLPGAAQNGQEFELADLSKNFNAFPVTVTPPAGDSIAGDATFVLNINKQVARFKKYTQGGSAIWSVAT